VTESEGCDVVSPSAVFTSFVRVGEQFGVFLGVPESLAKLSVVQGYEVFRILSRGGGGG